MTDFVKGITVVVLIVIWPLSIGTYFLLSPKHVHSYYLNSTGGGSNYTDGLHYTISIDIENGGDDVIILDKSITANEAMHLVDSLNQTLRK